MVAGANGNSLPVDDGSHVVRVDVAEHERNRSGPMLGFADQAYPRQPRKCGLRVGNQFCLVARDGLHANRLHVIQRRAEADGTRDVRRAGFEFGRRRCIARLFERDRHDHVAAALPRRHGFQQTLLAVEHADARGAVNLVS